MFTTSDCHDYLYKYSIKPSVQRTAVMEYLLNNRTHPTIDEIYSALSPSMPTLSRTTVYNTLDVFVSKGAVKQLVIDERNARFDVDISAHAHCMCSMCGKVSDVFSLNPIMYEFPFVEGFKIAGVDISYLGVCSNCADN